MLRFDEAAGPIREALTRLAESPRELRCFVVIEALVTGRFVQFCTLPPMSWNPPTAYSPGPLIFDGTGVISEDAYEYVQASCDADHGVELALSTLKRYLPPEAELRILEESTQQARPS